jgi:hypothetical protein
MTKTAHPFHNHINMKTKHIKKNPMPGEVKMLLRGLLVSTVGMTASLCLAFHAQSPIEALCYLFGGSLLVAVATTTWSLFAGDHL